LKPTARDEQGRGKQSGKKVAQRCHCLAKLNS
jgi:hypothetical protein